MTNDDIRDLILDIIEDIDDEADLENLNPDEPLRDQLDLDSMDFLDIVMELRKRHQLQIPEAADSRVLPPQFVLPGLTRRFLLLSSTPVLAGLILTIFVITDCLKRDCMR